jgi:hypothetical protein
MGILAFIDRVAICVLAVRAARVVMRAPASFVGVHVPCQPQLDATGDPYGKGWLNPYRNAWQLLKPEAAKPNATEPEQSYDDAVALMHRWRYAEGSCRADS